MAKNILESIMWRPRFAILSKSMIVTAIDFGLCNAVEFLCLFYDFEFMFSCICQTLRRRE